MLKKVLKQVLLNLEPKKVKQNHLLNLSSSTFFNFVLDISEMEPIPGTKINFPDSNNLMRFEVEVKPSDGLYAHATFVFNVDVPTSYPYDPPKVLCTTAVRIEY